MLDTDIDDEDDDGRRASAQQARRGPDVLDPEPFDPEPVGGPPRRWWEFWKP